MCELKFYLKSSALFLVLSAFLLVAVSCTTAVSPPASVVVYGQGMSREIVIRRDVPVDRVMSVIVDVLESFGSLDVYSEADKYVRTSPVVIEGGFTCQLSVKLSYDHRRCYLFCEVRNAKDPLGVWTNPSMLDDFSQRLNVAFGER